MSDEPESIQSLAREVLEVLRLQQEYFKRRDTGILAQSKEAERKLANRCRNIVNPGLFGGGR